MNDILYNYFEHGPKIMLPGIEEEMEMPRGAKFRYDGEVDSLYDNFVRTQLIIQGKIRPPEGVMDRIFGPLLDKLIIKAGSSKFQEDKPDIESTVAYCTPHTINDRTTAYVIAKKKGLDPSKSIFADGHESGELIQQLGQRPVLQKFLAKAGIELDSSAFEDHDDFADIGGMLALKKAAERGVKVALPTFKTREGVRAEILRCFGF